jgi:hypothetical protein
MNIYENVRRHQIDGMRKGDANQMMRRNDEFVNGHLTDWINDDAGG